MKKVILSTLNNLRRRLIILPSERHWIVPSVGVSRLSIKDEENNINEETEILKVKKEVLGILNDDRRIKGEREFFGESDVYLAREQEKYYNIFNQIIYDRFQWSNIYKGFYIEFHDSQLDENIEIMKRQFDEKYHQNILNDKFLNFINKDAQRLFEKNEIQFKEYEKVEIWGEDTRKPFFKLDNNYVEKQSKLSKLLIKLP